MPSPPLVGVVSDATSLDRALLILPFAFGVAGVIWMYAALRGERMPRET